MNYLISIDDTDMPGTRGTGWLAQELGELISRNGQGAISAISRHQLFVHKDVPYTSHNSAMCFELHPTHADIASITAFISGFLEQRSQEGSDPGLCIVPLEADIDYEKLITYGEKAKSQILTKQSAYDLAGELGIHLSEHGGTGQGVIGAVAGVGLRLSGNDGRYRGWYHLGLPGEVVSLEQLNQYDFIEELVTLNGYTLDGVTHVHVGSKKTKTVRINGRQVLVLMKNEDPSSEYRFRTMTKKEAKLY